MEHKKHKDKGIWWAYLLAILAIGLVVSMPHFIRKYDEPKPVVEKPKPVERPVTGYYVIVRVVTEDGHRHHMLNSVYALWTEAEKPNVGDKVYVWREDGRLVVTRNVAVDHPMRLYMRAQVADVFHAQIKN